MSSFNTCAQGVVTELEDVYLIYYTIVIVAYSGKSNPSSEIADTGLIFKKPVKSGASQAGIGF